MARKHAPAPFDGLVLVDKPRDLTSHDVVGRLRRLIGTRRVGHGGTLDPMATGVLVCGIGKATKLLGLISATDKTYEATIRLGVSTTTDDADGETLAVIDAGDVAEPGLNEVKAGIESLTGEIMQRPSSVSAIKVDGQRAYKRVRDGEDVILDARPVTISEFELLNSRIGSLDHGGQVTLCLDLDVRVTCSTGTYIRALARDLGHDLGVGGHLIALRRTRVGSFTLAAAHSLDELAESMAVVPLADVCRMFFTPWELDDTQAAVYRHGGRLDWPQSLPDDGDVVIFDTNGVLLGLASRRDGRLAPTVVWEPA